MKRAKKRLLIATATLVATAAVVGSVVWHQWTARRRQNILAEKRAQIGVNEKLAKVKEDFDRLARAIALYEVWFGHLPVPDWVRDLPEEEFFRFVPVLGGNPKTKEEYLKRESATSPVFIDGFKALTEYWKRTSGGRRDSPPENWLETYREMMRSPVPLEDPFLALRGRTVDPFDREGRLYGYACCQPMWCLLISSGPDGEREIDETRLDRWKPNMGYNVPLKCLAYDPTNGLVSRGDIYYYYPR